jgi:hypothetical protein
VSFPHRYGKHAAACASKGGQDGGAASYHK